MRVKRAGAGEETALSVARGASTAWHRGAEPPGAGSGAQGSADTFFPAQLADDGLVIHDAAVTVLCFRAIRRTDESLCL